MKYAAHDMERLAKQQLTSRVIATAGSRAGPDGTAAGGLLELSGRWLPRVIEGDRHILLGTTIAAMVPGESPWFEGLNPRA
jgi:hypothetical protein